MLRKDLLCLGLHTYTNCIHLVWSIQPNNGNSILSTLEVVKIDEFLGLQGAFGAASVTVAKKRRIGKRVFGSLVNILPKAITCGCLVRFSCESFEYVLNEKERVFISE